MPGILQRPSHTGSQVPSLDGLRGVAVLYVIFSHMSGSGLSLHPALNFVGSGKYGVYLFFVLSSFLLTLQYLDAPRERTGNARYWAAYAVRRIARIYPLFTVALATGLASSFMAHAMFGPREVTFFRHLLLLDGHKIFWAIPVEVKFYFLLPVLLVFFDRVLDRRTWPGVALVIVAIFAHDTLYPTGLYGGSLIALARYLAIFLFGHAAALAYAQLRERGLEAPVRRAADVAAVAIFAVVLAMVPALYSRVAGAPVVAYRFHAWVVWFGLAWSAFLLAYLSAGGFVQRVLEARPLRFFGVVSFSAYLWHLPLLELVRRNLYEIGPPAMIVVVLAAVALMSALSHIVVERPCMRAGARLSRRIERADGGDS